MYLKISFILSFFTCMSVFSQNSVPVKDSTQVYVKIEKLSKKNSFNSFFYHMIFKPIPMVLKPVKKKKKPKTNYYKNYEGKVIRTISIKTLDPFNFSVSDTSIVPQTVLTKAANSMHVKSQNITIRNLLLIRQNQTFDSLLVKESERLVRSQTYVRDVLFVTTLCSKGSDSVDISIRELDNWSIVPRVSVSSSYITFNVVDKNFMGMGHAFTNNFTLYNFNDDGAYFANYYIPNIRNTFVNATLHYGTDKNQNITKTFAIDRPFFSPFVKWASGVNFSQQNQKDSIQFPDSVFIPREYIFNSQDYWIGYAMHIFKGNTEKNRTTNLIVTARFLRVNFVKKPLEIVDPQHNYSNEHFYLAGIGISSRKYVQDSYIFKYGVTEDVPVGKVYCLTGGYQIKNNVGRLYMGVRFSQGNYHRWGYLSTNFEYGTFFRAKKSQQGMISASFNYSTQLLEIGKWKIRQFVKPQVCIGIKRFSYDSLTINDGYGLDGFNSKSLSGINRIVLIFQTQTYAPWNLIGFRFGPYVTYSMAMLSDASSGFIHSRVYSQFGLGVLIKNENLVLKSFQISLSFYPIIPGIGQDVFKPNAFRTTDFGFRDFEIDKPETTVFQ